MKINKTEVVHLDKHSVINVAEDNTLTKQPAQLELFRNLVSDDYSNSFDLYQSLPDTIPGHYSKYRNKDGTAKPINRIFEYRRTPCKLVILPGWLEEKGKYLAYFKGVREELVERAIHKLFVSGGFFHEDKENNNFTLVTSYYQIREELKKRGKIYSSNQIRDAIQILSTLRYQLEGIDDTKEGKSTFSPISVEYYNENKKVDKNGKNARLVIYLNRLVSKDVLKRDWTQIGYKKIMSDNTYLGRWIRTKLYLRFKQAGKDRYYNFNLSRLINEGIIYPYKALIDNITYVKKVLNSLTDTLETYEVSKLYAKDPKTKRTKIVDAKFKLYANDEFIKEMIRLNVHHKALRDAIETDQGLLVQPFIDQYDTRKEYEKARKNYLIAIGKHTKDC